MIDPREAVQAFADDCIRCGVCARTDCGNFSNGEPCLGDICESILNGEDTWGYFPFTCALCNRCTVHCPVGLSANNASKPMRALGLEANPDLKPVYRKFRTDLKYNLFTTLSARNRGDINDIRFIEGEPNVGGVADHTAFFPGCALYAYAPELVSKVSQWLRDEGIAAYTITTCCGATFYDVGFFEEYKAYKKRAQEFFREHSIEHLIVVCPHCNYLLPELVEGTGIDIVHLPDILLERGMASDSTEAISFHDSCYDRKTGAFGNAARKLFPDATHKSMFHEKEETVCCGGGGMVSMYAPDYCEYRRNLRLAEIDQVEADRVFSTCHSCVNSLQRGVGTTPVQHYLESIFDVAIDWGEVYAGVDALFADPAYEKLCQSDEPAL